MSERTPADRPVPPEVAALGFKAVRDNVPPGSYVQCADRLMGVFRDEVVKALDARPLPAPQANGGEPCPQPEELPLPDLPPGIVPVPPSSTSEPTPRPTSR